MTSLTEAPPALLGTFDPQLSASNPNRPGSAPERPRQTPVTGIPSGPHLVRGPGGWNVFWKGTWDLDKWGQAAPGFTGALTDQKTAEVPTGSCPARGQQHATEKNTANAAFQGGGLRRESSDLLETSKQATFRQTKVEDHE